jgi:hypothetical protein
VRRLVLPGVCRAPEAGTQQRMTSQEPRVQAEETAHTAGRLAVWVVIVGAALAALVGIFLLGPIGLAVAIPVALALWLLVGAAAGGGAAGGA